METRSVVRYVTLLATLAVAGCASQPDHILPSIASKSLSEVEPRQITESEILSALKCQLAKGFEEVNELKKRNSRSEKFQYKSGVGTLSGKMQTVRTKGGTVNIVLPFSGFAGTNATPSYGSSKVITEISEQKRTFNIKPRGDSNATALCSDLESRGVSVGTFVENAVVAGFEGIANVAVGGVELENTTIETTSSFIVERKKNFGFALKSVPSAPRIDELNPQYTGDGSNTQTYTITTKLETKVAQENSSQRITYCVRNQQGSLLCLEDPYTDERWEQQIDLLEQDDRVGRAPDPDLNTLQEFVAQQNIDPQNSDNLINKIRSSAAPNSLKALSNERLEYLIQEAYEPSARDRFPDTQQGVKF